MDAFHDFELYRWYQIGQRTTYKAVNRVMIALKPFQYNSIFTPKDTKNWDHRPVNTGFRNRYYYYHNLQVK